MKAKVKATGEIVEVKKHPIGSIYSANNGKHYWNTDLDSNLDDPQTTVTIEGWVRRDKYGILIISRDEPYEDIVDDGSISGKTEWITPGGSIGMNDPDFLPDLTWKSSPRKVSITIKLEKE